MNYINEQETSISDTKFKPVFPMSAYSDAGFQILCCCQIMVSEPREEKLAFPKQQ